MTRTLLRHGRLVALSSLIVLAACSSAAPYDSPALAKLAPIVEMDRAAAQSGTPLSLVKVRDTANQAGMTVHVGASRGLDTLSVETISGGGTQRVFAMLDGEDCLFGVVDTTAAPVAVYWLIIKDVYTATDVTASATCSASAYFGIDLEGVTLSPDPSSPTRLG